MYKTSIGMGKSRGQSKQPKKDPVNGFVEL